MKPLSRMGTAAIELGRSELESLQRYLNHMTLVAGFAVALGLAALVGLGILVAGLVQCLSRWLPDGTAAMLVGGMMMIGAAVGLRAVGIGSKRRYLWEKAIRRRRWRLAKAQVLQSAQEANPLAVMREHPFATVAISASAGAALGAGATELDAAASLIRLVGGTIGPIAMALSQSAQMVGNVTDESSPN